MKTRMKIGFLIFVFGCGCGFMYKHHSDDICRIENEIQILKSESEIENENCVCVKCINENRIEFSEFEFIEDFESQKIISEIQVPFYEITNEERETICNIVAGEAIGESYKCKKLVAQCIFNSMTINDYTPTQVRKEYRYDGWWPECRTLYPDAWADVEKAVEEIFDYGNFEVYDSIEYFYSTKYCTSKWHESLRFVIQDGSTRFFSKFEKAC